MSKAERELRGWEREEIRVDREGIAIKSLFYNVCVTIIKISFSSWYLPYINDISHP